MKYRPLGKTGLKVSILGYGAAPLGGNYRATSESAGIQSVYTAIDSGINFIDVSPGNSNCRAETVLGKALRNLPRDQYYLSTKVGSSDGKAPDYSADQVTQSIEESLKRLHVTCIDIVHCQDVESASFEQLSGETIPALLKLKEEGKLRFIGLSSTDIDAIQTLLAQLEVDTVLPYCRYNLQDHSLANFLPKLQEHEIGVINAAPLSSGLLTLKGPPSWHPASEKIRQLCAEAANLCIIGGVDIAQIAIQFAVKNEAIATTLVGSTNCENLRRNVDWIEEPAEEELLEEISKIFEFERDSPQNN